MMARRILSLLVLAVAILVVSCSAPTQPPQAVSPTQAPAQPATQAPAPTSTSAPAATATQAAPTQAALVASATLTTAPTAAPMATATKPAATAAPTQASASTSSAAKAAAAQPTAGAPAKLNMDAIFPPGPGRDVVLENCTTCHTFVPLVVLQYTQSQWDLSARNHRDRVPRLSDADFKAAYAYLAANFNPEHPVPQLPQNLLDTWTDY